MRKLIIILSLTLAPVIASASVIIPLAEPKLVAAADTVFWGTVVDITAQQDANGFVTSLFKVQVYQGLKGTKLGDEVIIEVPGGDLNTGVSVAVTGSPRPNIGDMVFCFAERHGQTLRPLGMSFGMLAIKQEAGTNNLRVYRNLNGLQLTAKSGKAIDATNYMISGEKFDDFIARIEKQIQALPTQSAAKNSEVQK
ncbi:MAG: hypothetical protein JW841_13900 [Deltaproteobacteria bacterium]|nr:hypothetical protein [Deltaproteobacteria bacterium]